MLSFLFPIITVILIVTNHVRATFPDHNATEDKMINPVLDPRDNPACGLFRPDRGRVFRGTEAYEGQFPWTVCLIGAVGKFAKKYANGDWRQNEGMVQESIYNFGPNSKESKRSGIQEEIFYLSITNWKRFCTGSIVHSNWILTAAHCLEYLHEAFVFVINAGVTHCMSGPHEHVREVIVQREDNELRTIFEHETFVRMKGRGVGRENYDLALIRLVNGLDIPVNTYNGELINSICLFTTDQLPKTGCLNNIYFSGFGLKKDPPNVKNVTDSEDEKLTYLKMFRTSFELCALALRENLNRFPLVYCYSPIIKHFKTDEKLGKTNPDTIPQKTVIAIRNETEMRNTPDTCPGDSGGPFMYFMRIDDNYSGGNLPDVATSSVKLQTGYRALQLSTLYGEMPYGKQESRCEGQFTRGEDAFWKKLFPSKRGWYKGFKMGPKLNHFLDWFNHIMFVRRHGGIPEKIYDIFNKVHFPNTYHNEQ